MFLGFPLGNQEKVDSQHLRPKLPFSTIPTEYCRQRLELATEDRKSQNELPPPYPNTITDQEYIMNDIIGKESRHYREGADCTLATKSNGSEMPGISFEPGLVITEDARQLVKKLKNYRR